MPFAGGIGVWELALLLALAILLFGAKKLPGLARSAGRGVRELKQPVKDAKESVTIDELKDVAALRSPKTALRRMLDGETRADT
jgi:TatA/E family protein of Tat protein translocase